MNDLISVIVPIYNVEKYLKKCIDSIINQTYRNLEIILVDDGSPDNCGKICDDYAQKDNRIKVIHKENGGQGSARNKALDICTGNYIAFVDSDDYIENNMFKTMLKILEENDADIIQCGTKFRSCSTGNIIEISHCDKNEVDNTEKLIYNYLTGKVTTVMWDKLYRSNLFDGIRFPDVYCREDVYILHEILGCCKNFVLIPQCLYIQNIREGSTERIGFNIEKLKVTRHALERTKEYIKINFPQHCYLMNLSLVDMYYGFLKEIVSSGVKTNKIIYTEVLNELKNELKVIDNTKLNDDQKSRYQYVLKKTENQTKLYYELKMRMLKIVLKKKIKIIMEKLR